MEHGWTAILPCCGVGNAKAECSLSL